MNHSVCLRLLLLVIVSGCASWPKSLGAQPCCVDGKPFVREQSIGWHLFDVTVLSPVAEGLHLVRSAKRGFGRPIGARNLQDGRVTHSVFLTDRDPATLTPEDVRWGPTSPADAASPPFTITKPKLAGKTPGFFITDARGVRYLLKLDPVDAPELLSGAEVVTSRLLHALGYRVPGYEIVFVRPDEFQIDPKAAVNTSRATREPLTVARLGELLLPRVHEGTVRAVASRIVEGEILGPARFKQFRDCAEIRALKLAYAWVNNIDAKDHNTLLVWDGTKTKGYLIDFGTSLGADAGRAAAKQPCAGWTNIVDLKEFTLELLTLGFHRSRCDTREQALSPAVGLFSPRLDPERWKPYVPNRAFEEMTDEDGRWMAQRLQGLSHDHLEAAVAAGQYSDPADASYLVEVLRRRREAIVARYLHDPAQKGTP